MAVPLVAVLLSTALLAACGGDEPGNGLGGDDQRAALTRDQKAIWDVRGGQNASVASHLHFEVVADLSKKDCSVKTRALHDSLAGVIRQVEALRPPAEAEDAQGDFLSAAKESVRLVGAAAHEVDAGDLTCGRAMNERIYDMPSTRRTDKAIDELTKLGYNVLGN